MKKIPEILYLKSARNAEHYNLQQSLLEAAPAEFATKFKLTELRDNYAALFDKEDDVYLQNRAFADSEEVQASDVERDGRLSFYNLSLKVKKLSKVKEDEEAVNKLLFVGKPYARASSKPHAENTAMVDDLVKKLQSDEYAGYVEKLGLTGAVADLKKANDDFKVVYSRRATEKLTREVGDKLKELRPQVDAAAAKYFEAINALYLVNDMIEKDTSKAAEIGAVIDAVNAEILQFSQTLSRRGVGSKTKIEDDRPIIPPDEGGNEPGGGGGGEDDRPVIE